MPQKKNSETAAQGGIVRRGKFAQNGEIKPPAGAHPQRYRLLMHLNDTEIWRHLEIPGSMSFADLHSAIQIAFGWEDMHLHLFTVHKMRIGICPDGNVDDLPPNFYFEEDVCLELILLNVKKFLYEYDFGDGWAVTIYVEKAEEVQKVSPPRLINICGGMACDDCGGPDGLAELPPIAADIAELNLILEETFDQ